MRWCWEQRNPTAASDLGGLLLPAKTAPGAHRTEPLFLALRSRQQAGGRASWRPSRLTFHPAERVLPSAEGAGAVRGVEGAVGLHQVLALQPCHSLQRVYVLQGETEGSGSGVRHTCLESRRQSRTPQREANGTEGEGREEKQGAGCACKLLCSFSGGRRSVKVADA